MPARRDPTGLGLVVETTIDYGHIGAQAMLLHATELAKRQLDTAPPSPLE